MTIEEIFSKDKPDEVIAELKARRHAPQPDTASAKKALEQSLHNINDRILRPDKRVKVDNDNEANSAQKVIEVGGKETKNYKIEKVARISLAIQKLIVKRAVAFLFGNPVAYNVSPEGNNQEAIVKALKRILHDVKSNSLNRRVARAVFGFKECAELWYPVEKPNNSYGFNSKFKLRCALFSPAFGDALFPYFDETGDLTAFSREFSRTEFKDSKEVKVNYFETYTDAELWLWRQGANGFEVVEGYPRQIAIGKIPVIYAYQEEFETQDVDSLIDRLETLLSNFADTNDYHAAPKLFVTGVINGWAKKGEAGAVIEGEEGATMQYVSWANAPEAVKLEIETLLRMIYTITQTPDISFDSVKGIGAVSGIALQLLFMDAHLKVQDKREIFDEYLQRRVNVIKSFIGKFNTTLESECADLEIEPEITPYMLTSEIEELNYWLTANGQKPLISQEEAVEKAGLSANPKETYGKIVEETSREKSFFIGEPTFDA